LDIFCDLAKYLAYKIELRNSTPISQAFFNSSTFVGLGF
jgi:hypothetical protein